MAPWKGTLRLTGAQRAALRVGPVTDALIDAVLPTVEYIAYWRRQGDNGKIDTATRRRRAQQHRTAADVVEAFAALFDGDGESMTREVVTAWLIERGMAARKAWAESAAFADRLREHARWLRTRADKIGPRPGLARDEHAADLVRTAAESWREHTGRRPAVSTTGPFAVFCHELGALAGIELERDKVRHLLDRAN